jgi:rod shape-determining protein MreD
MTEITQRRTTWKKLDARVRTILPFSLTVTVLLFGMTPTYVPGLAQITPMYTLVAVYFWAIYRPDLLGYGLGFAIGVLEDLLTGAPLGVGTLVLLLIQWVVFNQHKFFHAKPFVITWFAFGLVAFGAVLLKWVGVGLVSSSGPTPFGDVFASYLITVAVYPIVAWLFSKVRSGLLDEP